MKQFLKSYWFDIAFALIAIFLVATLVIVTPKDKVGSSILSIFQGGTNASTQTANGINYFDGTKITSASGFIYNGTTATSTGNIDFSLATVKEHVYPAFSYSTTTWTGTTTIPLGPAYVAETWNGVKCFTDTGTVNISFYDGANRMNLLNASTTVGTFLFSTNNTFTSSEKRYVDIGTPASSPKVISCTVDRTINLI